jgi:hypothetical protein
MGAETWWNSEGVEVCRYIPVLSKVGDKLIIRMKPGLGKAGNSFDYSM